MGKAQMAKTLGLHAMDTALTTIDADEYVVIRLTHAAAKLKISLAKCYRQNLFLRVTTFILAGCTTFLALPGVGLSIWNVPLFALIDICDRVLSLTQCEVRLEEGNSTVLKLTEISSWWASKGYGGKIKTKNISKLVYLGEEALLSYEATSLQALRVAASTEKDDDQDEEGKATEAQKK